MEDGRSELVIKYLQGQLDTQGINDFYTWVNENVENKKVFFEIKAVYDACYTNRMQNDMEGSWDRLLKKRKVFYPRKKSRWLQLGNYAAVSFITVCLTSLFLTFNKDEDKIATRYIGGDGLDADVVELPDGTQVCLGSKTVFHYENDYGRKERIVYLEGEAYFEVAKNKDLPFVVKANGIDVKAIGTAFNVSAYMEDSQLTTTLFNGKVAVQPTLTKQEVLLEPNQVAVYDKSRNKIEVVPYDKKQFAQWRGGFLSFEMMYLQDITKLLERNYNVVFRYENQGIKKLRFSGSFRNNEDLSEILNVIKTNTGIRYQILKDTIVIK